MKPEVYLVSVPIGNLDDISYRAKRLLNDCTLLIAEEAKPTWRLLHHLGISKEYELLNEHTRKGDLDDLMLQIRSSPLTCIISDAGTPILEDPGHDLVQKILDEKIYLGAVPGANAVTTALVLSGFKPAPFTFYGFLNKDRDIRKREIQKILKINHTVVLYETPYRYKALLSELYAAKKNLDIFLGLDITGPGEFQFRGRIGDLMKKLDHLPKAPPVIVLDLSQNPLKS